MQVVLRILEIQTEEALVCFQPGLCNRLSHKKKEKRKKNEIEGGRWREGRTNEGKEKERRRE